MPQHPQDPARPDDPAEEADGTGPGLDIAAVAERASERASGAAQEASRGVEDTSTVRTVVHLLRHGEVDNPRKILYGRLPGYHLSDLGRQMAEAVVPFFAGRDLALVVCSPLERTQETAAPVAADHGLTPVIDPRVIEAGNRFEGSRFEGKGFLRRPWRLWWVRNPTVPTWGESYAAIARRMTAAIEDARDHARGREALVVSHQLPVWTMRSVLEGRRLWHDPRRRECNLASVTSVTYEGDRVVEVSYSEPAAHLYPQASAVPGA